VHAAAGDGVDNGFDGDTVAGFVHAAGEGESADVGLAAGEIVAVLDVEIQA